MKSKPCRFPPNISSAVFHKLAHYNGGNVGKRIVEVMGFTELEFRHPPESNELEHSALHVIRACPSFRASRPWFDWAVIQWETDDGDLDLDAQVLMMLDMTSVVFEDCPATTQGNQRNEAVVNIAHDPIKMDKVAFVHSTKHDRKDTSHSGRKSLVAFWLEMEENYQMIDVDCIKSPCFVVVDKFKTEETGGRYMPGYATDIIKLIPKPEWSNKFLKYEDRRLVNQAWRNKDDTVTNLELKPYET